MFITTATVFVMLLEGGLEVADDGVKVVSSFHVFHFPFSVFKVKKKTSDTKTLVDKVVQSNVR